MDGTFTSPGQTPGHGWSMPRATRGKRPGRRLVAGCRDAGSGFLPSRSRRFRCHPSALW